MLAPSDFRALDRRIWWLAVARMIVTAGFSMVLPFLAIHLTVERKFPAVVAGIIWTAAGVAGAATQWAAGALSDRIGRRGLMSLSLVARACNMAALGWATSHQASAVFLGALCVVNASLRAFFDPVANAAVADLTPADKRVAAYSLQRVGTNLGWAAGPAIHGLAEGVPYGTLFYWTVPFTLLALLTVLRIQNVPGATREPGTRRPGLREMFAFLKDRAYVRVLWSTIAFFVLQAQLYQSLSIFAARNLHLSRAAVGTLYTLNGVLVVLLQLAAVSWIDRLGTRGALVWGSLGYAAAYACTGLTFGHTSLAMVVVAVTMAEITVAPAQQTTVAAMAPPGKMGAYAGLYGLAQSVGQSAGPLVGTSLLDTVPARLAWPLLALFGVVAAIGYRGTQKNPKNALVLGGKA